ncbi:helix-turn-helix domain-containing protein [Porphyrobacter sp. AAP60]|uniref:helix-turn-helix domain-containing protein n=1 Tax=Porphyrobacter sp. AAP60 TaxID=1523423 RepID=UPI0006B8BBC9|nr:helix-turn-helix domain-containing protein [Porphyrobacter sp. AAP60]KPF63101.1 XRE family transcriptional regulator [Porphyrobacter sp. AAP60]
MAIKAHLGSPAASDSQRATPRRALRLEASGLGPDGAEANVTIHNISAAGLLLETGLALNTGEQLAIDLPEAGIVTAVIVWRSERLFGCAFEQALGPAALAAAQLQGLAPSSPGHAALRGAGTHEALGPKLNRLRREAGLTLADVAAALGVSKPTVWAWEKGKARPLPERLEAIAAALGSAPEQLAESTSAAGDASTVIEECRSRIAAACGTPAASVKIMIEL